MDWSSDSEENEDSYWDAYEATSSSREASEAGPSHTNASEAGPSQIDCAAQYVAMGFSEELVAKAIQQNRGGEDTNGVVETLLAYTAVENSPKIDESSGHCSLESDNDALEDDFSDMEDFGFEDFTEDLFEKDRTLSTLVDMGFSAEESSTAIDRCGPNASILELADSIHAAQMQDDCCDQFSRQPVLSSDDNERCAHGSVRLKTSVLERRKKRAHVYKQNRVHMKKVRLTSDDDEAPIVIPKPMVGFGLPFKQHITRRELPEAAIGPPFFYYENVALAPKGVWDTISRFLYDIKPEFVDSKFFCAAARKRGYVHNLPLANRFPLLPVPSKTIHEAFPLTKKWWPPWDARTHFNCLQTCIASAKNTERIRAALAGSDGLPSERVRKWILFECRKWNLVWVGHNKLAPLEPDEYEMLLGFPRDHTRGNSRTERYKSLGNSFQIDTVAFHLSVLRDMFPNGVNVLSLFSGIGGAEVALHRLGIRMKTVVSVELSEVNRTVVTSWWEQTKQTGKLIHLSDIQQLNGDRLEHFICTYGGFDLVIGGSPCNNLAGSNRHHRDGLDGKHSALFYDYFRILDHVKCIMGKH